MQNKLWKLLALAAVGSTCWLGIRPQPAPKHPPQPVNKMSDAQLVLEWQYANSDRYEIGCELDRRRIHANWRTPPGTNSEGYVRMNLRGCWYGLHYWHEPNSDPKWRD